MTISPISGTPATDVDVLIVGAGISGIGAAYHLRTLCPDTSFTILEGRDDIGGTWNTFRYPGIRSDSDMPTYGFGFKPWTHPRVIADGDVILDYLQEVLAENDIEEHIRFGHHVLGAEYSSSEGRWTITAERADSGERVHLTSRFLLSCTGYYDHEAGFSPEFAGIDDFEGEVIHPQHWPDDLDYTDQRVVVIGSGATAVTLIPAMADTTRHITMLQRSPSYVLSLPGEDLIANTLNKILGPERAYPIVRRKNIWLHRTIYKACRRAPRLMRRLLIAQVRLRLPKQFDVDTHFAPHYDPWDQRLCMVPDADLFRTISSGKASVVTDRIERFTPKGILLESGRELAADLVVTATGLNLSPFGKMDLRVDGREVNLPDTTVYKGMMLSGVPNFAFIVGYTNISWTLRADLVAEHFCRLLAHMEARGLRTVEPVLEDADMERVPLLDLTAGYVQRAIDTFPRAGTRGPWIVDNAYENDVMRLREAPIDDPALRFTTHRSAPTASAETGRAS